jgi:uncharacterized membrane protein YeaQ/YmgE (transglycosylase-associated protein family)
MGIIGWIVVGAVVGLLASWLIPGRFPGGVLGAVAGGAAGAFVGGGIFSLIADRGAAEFDAVSLLSACFGAALVLRAVRKAGYAEPYAR